MIKFENTEVFGWEHAIRGMRNPMNSWDKSDSDYVDIYYWMNEVPNFRIGENDYKLMMSLAKGGPTHAKYRRMIAVYVDITAPLYWWKEFDTYKVGTVANSCSTMHKIHEKEFVLEDFSHENLFLKNSSGQFFLHGTDLKIGGIELFNLTINVLNGYRKMYAKEDDPQMRKLYWWQMIQLLPSSYNQKRTVLLNYEVLTSIYSMRKDHKLDEWIDFCKWIEDLPYYEFITLGRKNNEG